MLQILYHLLVMGIHVHNETQEVRTAYSDLVCFLVSRLMNVECDPTLLQHNPQYFTRYSYPATDHFAQTWRVVNSRSGHPPRYLYVSTLPRGLVSRDIFGAWRQGTNPRYVISTPANRIIPSTRESQPRKAIRSLIVVFKVRPRQSSDGVTTPPLTTPQSSTELMVCQYPQMSTMVHVVIRRNSPRRSLSGRRRTATLEGI
jgi:hypothetical protein